MLQKSSSFPSVFKNKFYNRYRLLQYSSCKNGLIFGSSFICSIFRPRRSRSAAACSHHFPVNDLSVGQAVGLSVQCIVENGRSDPDAVWHRRSDGSKDEAGSGFGDRSTERGTFGANLGRVIVTNGNFTAYVCDHAATRPFSQITLGKLVGFAEAYRLQV